MTHGYGQRTHTICLCSFSLALIGMITKHCGGGLATKPDHKIYSLTLHWMQVAALFTATFLHLNCFIFAKSPWFCPVLVASYLLIIPVSVRLYCGYIFDLNCTCVADLSNSLLLACYLLCFFNYLFYSKEKIPQKKKKKDLVIPVISGCLVMITIDGHFGGNQTRDWIINVLKCISSLNTNSNMYSGCSQSGDMAFSTRASGIRKSVLWPLFCELSIQILTGLYKSWE